LWLTVELGIVGVLLELGAGFVVVVMLCWKGIAVVGFEVKFGFDLGFDLWVEILEVGLFGMWVEVEVGTRFEMLFGFQFEMRVGTQLEMRVRTRLEMLFGIQFEMLSGIQLVMVA
jgi:hypothetical protein